MAELASATQLLGSFYSLVDYTKAGAQAIADVMAVIAANKNGNLRLSAVRAGSETASGD